MSEYLIRGLDIYKIYRNSGVETAILKGITLNVYEGEKLILIGPSGSGKTTLVNILIGEIKPNAGQLFWYNYDKDVTKLSKNQIAIYRREFIGYIDQRNNIIPQLTVKENIMMAKLFFDRNGNDVDHLKTLTKLLGIDHLLHKKATKLSQGEKKRVNIASALINNPKVLIADEPVEGLDPVTANILLDLLDQINQELKTTIIMTTHDQIVATRGDRILELDNGILSGAHENDISLFDLEKTRKIVIDPYGRIQIPEEIISALNNPKVLHLEFNNNTLKLTVDENNQDLVTSDRIYQCLQCTRFATSAICSKCGSATIIVKM